MTGPRRGWLLAGAGRLAPVAALPTVTGSLMVLLSMVLVSMVLVSSPANAASGTWGSAKSPYSNGVICSPGPATTVPLASWNLGGAAGSVAFLLAGLSSTGGLDSGKVPFATLGQQTASPLVATGGGLTAAQIAATASLIRLSGSDPNPARVAEVAELVAAQNGRATGEQCLAGGQGGTSPADAAALWARAQALAGPYQVAIRSANPLFTLGTRESLTASVTSAAGQPVPGVDLTLSTSGAVLTSAQGGLRGAQGGNSITVTTGAAGTAAATITVPDSDTASTISVATTIAVPIGLTQITVPGAVAAVTLSAATRSSVSTEFAVDTTPDPVLSTGFTATGLAIGGSVRPTVTVSGMHGHSATVTLTVYGPAQCAALADSTLTNSTLTDDMPTNDSWAAAVAADPTGALVANRATLAIAGDGSPRSAGWKPTKPGCYAAVAALATADISPPITRRSAFSVGRHGLIVIATSASMKVDHGGLFGPGPITASVTVANPSGTLGPITGALLGPLLPVANSCSGLDWSSARRVSRVTATHVAADGHLAVTATGATTTGCYNVALAGSTSFPNLGTVPIPVTAAPADGTADATVPAVGPSTTALVITPAVASTEASTWAITPGPVKESVDVHGSVGQHAKLTFDMMWAPANPLGCSAVDWRTATRAATSTATPVAADGTYEVESGSTPKVGCYSAIAVITTDANPQIVGKSAIGASRSLFLAAPPAASPQLPTRLISQQSPLISTRVGIAFSGYLTLLLFALAITVGIALRRPAAAGHMPDYFSNT
jgi:hypothetical protein